MEQLIFLDAHSGRKFVFLDFFDFTFRHLRRSLRFFKHAKGAGIDLVRELWAMISFLSSLPKKLVVLSRVAGQIDEFLV